MVILPEEIGYSADEMDQDKIDAFGGRGSTGDQTFRTESGTESLLRSGRCTRKDRWDRPEWSTRGCSCSLGSVVTACSLVDPAMYHIYKHPNYGTGTFIAGIIHTVAVCIICIISDPRARIAGIAHSISLGDTRDRTPGSPGFPEDLVCVLQVRVIMGEVQSGSI